MLQSFADHLNTTLAGIEADGLLKREREIASPQSGEIRLADGRKMINLCANNYLGLADHPEIIAAARDGLDRYGFGMASVRFICGTLDLHRELERAIAKYLGKDDAILFAACFDANGGLFETLLTDEDAIISDALEPRLDHRRRAALQGQALSLRDERHGRPRDAAEAGRRPTARASRSSPPTACSRWTASSQSCPRSARWRRSTARW